MPSVKDAQHLPQQALVLDDADVALDVRIARYALGQKREVRRAADGVQLAPLLQRVHHGNQVNRMAQRQQVGHHAVDAPVRVQREVVRNQLGRGVGDGHRIQQHRTQHRHLGLHRGREAIVRVGHDESCHRATSLWRRWAVENASHLWTCAHCTQGLHSCLESSATPAGTGAPASVTNRCGSQQALPSRARSLCISASALQLSNAASSTARASRVGWPLDAVVHPLALAPRRHNPRPPQVRQVPRDLRLPLLQYLHEVADTNLAPVHQVQQPQPRAVCQRRKQRHQIQTLSASRHHFNIRLDRYVGPSIYSL
jgi:hypothetical protein